MYDGLYTGALNPMYTGNMERKRFAPLASPVTRLTFPVESTHSMLQQTTI